MRIGKLLLLCRLVASNSLFGQFGPAIDILQATYSWNPTEDRVAFDTKDLDQDGDMDIVIRSTFGIVWYENMDGEGNFAAPDTIAMFLFPGTGSQIRVRHVFADLDGDGDLDLALYERNGPEHFLYWKENDGSTFFGPIQEIADAQGMAISNLNSPAYGLSAADMNGDGAIDLVFSSDGQVKWFLGEQGNFTDLRSFAYLTQGSAKFTVGDLDNDGTNDVMLVGQGSLQAWLNTEGTGEQWEFYEIDGGWQSTPGNGFELIDLDGDGDLDVVDVANYLQWKENLLENDEFGDFASSPVLHPNPLYGSGDIGNIGCNDGIYLVYRLWFTGDSPIIHWIRFDQDIGSFTGPIPDPDTSPIGYLRLGDLNGDGFDDLITLHGNPAIMKWSPNIMGDASNWLSLELPFDTIGLTDAPQSLTGGAPEGGAYTLAGDTLTEFDPMTAGLGTHEIIYTYTDPFTGCTGSDTAMIVVELSTGITDRASQRQLLIHPNPASGECLVQFSLTRNDKILIHDALGRLVGAYQAQQSPFRIDTTGLAPVSYTVTLEQENGRQHAVLVVE